MLSNKNWALIKKILRIKKKETINLEKYLYKKNNILILLIITNYCKFNNPYTTSMKSFFLTQSMFLLYFFVFRFSPISHLLVTQYLIRNFCIDKYKKELLLEFLICNSDSCIFIPNAHK